MTDVIDNSTTEGTRETLQCKEEIPSRVEEPKLVLQKLSLHISDNDVAAYFASLSVQVKSVNWIERRTCVVEFSSLTDAETALAASRAQNLGGTKIDWARPEHNAKEPNLPKNENGTSSSVCIAKLAKDVRESELVKVLQACGQVTGIQMLQDETDMFNGTALVTYSREEEAALAVEQLRGLKLFGQPVEVTRAGGCPDSTTTRYPLDSCLTQRAAVPESSAKHHVSEPPHHHGFRALKKRPQEEPRYKREDSPEVLVERRSSPQPARQGSPPSSLSTEAHRSLSLKKRILQKVVEDNDMQQSQSRPNSEERRGLEQTSWYYNVENDSDGSSPVRSTQGERASPRRSGRETRRKCVIPEEDESSNELEVDEFAEEREAANGGDSSWEPSEDGIERPSEDKELEVLMMCQKVVDEYDRPEQSETAVYYLLDTLRNTRRTRPEVPKRCRNPLNYEDIFRKLGMIQDPKNSAHYHCWQLPPQGSTQRAFMDEIRAEGRLKKNAEKLNKAKTESVARKELKPSSISLKEREKRRGRKRKSQDRDTDSFIDRDEMRERKKMTSLSNLNNRSSIQPKRRGPGRPPKREKLESWVAESEERSFAERRIGDRKRKPKRIYPFEEEEEEDSDYISSEHESEEDRLYFKRKEAKLKKIGEESEPGTLRKRARKAPSILSVLAGRDENDEDEDVEVVGDVVEGVVLAAPKEIVKNVASIEKELGVMMEEINMKMQALQEKQNQMLLMKEKMRLMQTC